METKAFAMVLAAYGMIYLIIRAVEIVFDVMI